MFAHELPDRDARSCAETRRALAALPDDCASSGPGVWGEAPRTLANRAKQKLEACYTQGWQVDGANG